MDIKEINERKLDALDFKIVALFEQRMMIAEKAAKDMTKRELKAQTRRVGEQASDKATRFACDVTTIAYTEELIKLMLCATCHYQRRLLRSKKGKVKLKPC